MKEQAEEELKRLWQQFIKCDLIPWGALSEIVKKEFAARVSLKRTTGKG